MVAGRVETILDVAHNRDSARRLAGFLGERPCAGSTWLVLGMLEDKDVSGFVTALAGQVDTWCLASITDARGLTAAQLAARAGIEGEPRLFDNVADAVEHAQAHAVPGDRIVVTGSFLCVASALTTRV